MTSVKKWWVNITTIKKTKLNFVYIGIIFLKRNKYILFNK
jgi:hypothetical protein